MSNQTKGSKLLLVLLLVWIFDGALRKWLFPGLSRPLFFLYLAVAARIYFLAIKRKAFIEHKGYILLALVALFALTALQVWHVSSHNESGSTALYGWIMYTSLIFLPIALPTLVDRAQVMATLRMVLYLSWPMAILTIGQVTSSASSILNKTFVEGYVPLGTTGGTLRASGTFSSATGMGQFIVLSVVALLVISEDRKGSLGILLLKFGPPVLIMIFLAGSRGAVFGAGLVLMTFLICQAVTTPGRAIRTTLVGVTIIFVGFLLANSIASHVLTDFGDRFEQASTQESTSGRILDGITSADGVIDTAPSWGYGLGAFSRGGVRYYSASWIENEPARVVMEAGPLVGMLLLGLRYLGLIWLFRICIRIARKSRRLAQFALLAQAAPLLVSGQITGQGDTNVLFWLTASMITCWAGTTAPVNMAGLRKLASSPSRRDRSKMAQRSYV